MKKIIGLMLCLTLLFCAGCQKQVALNIPTIPPTPELSAGLKVIAESNMPEADKARAMDSLIASTERMYSATLARAQDAGKNVVTTVSNFLNLVMTGVTAVLAAKK